MHSLDFGGAERSLVNFLHELPDDKYHVDILLFQKKGTLIPQLPKWVTVLDTPADLNALYAPIRKAGRLAVTKVFGTVCAKTARKTRKAQAAYRWKRFYCKKIGVLQQQYDAAVAYGGSELMYFVIDRVPADRKIVWIHSDYRAGKYSAEDDAPYFAAADEIVSMSEVCVNILKETFPEQQKKIQCIENITSSAMLKVRAEAFEPKEYKKSGCNLLSVGRLSNEKGFDLAVQAAAILKENGVDFYWYVIGKGPVRKKLEKQIQQLKVEDRFFLLGTRSNPYPYMKQCTALIQPSRYEGKSVVLDEAKILSVPIVATAYPTVQDQITEGMEGHITPITAEGIAEGIQKLLSDPDQLLAIRCYLESHEYGNSAELQKYIDLLDKSK